MGMNRVKKQNRKSAAGILLCIAAAMLFRKMGRGASNNVADFLRSFLYIGLFLYWGISVRRRVVQPQVQHLMTAIALLMVFWIADRTVKFFLVVSPDWIRYLWYLYYFPMLFIPFLSVLVAISLGKPEQYRLPKWMYLLYIPVSVLLLLVLTNDFHQLVFQFPAEASVWRDNEYKHGVGYYVVMAGMVVCALLALGVMIAKCRGSHSRKTVWLPLIFIAVTISYSALYIAGFVENGSVLHTLAGDLTVTLCLLFAGTLESCLQAGLIPSNTGYDALFRTVSAGILITDKEGQIRYASDHAIPLSKAELLRLQKQDFLLDDSTYVKSYKIHGGYAVWQENVSEIVQVRKALESAKEELKDRNELLRDQYREDAKRYRLEEQNRLYDLVQRETQRQLREIDELSEQYAHAERNSKERQMLLLRILVLATYIKRHKDMVISEDRSHTMSLGRLISALRESCSNLTMAGMSGNLYLPGWTDAAEAWISIRSAISAYDMFEDILEVSLDSLQYFYITIAEEAGDWYLRFNVECRGAFDFLSEKYNDTEVEKDEESWFLSQKLEQVDHLREGEAE